MSGRLLVGTRVDWRRLVNLAGLLVGVTVVALFVSAAIPQVVGADASYVVRSDSMSPSIEAGSVVYVSSVPAAEISTGDVITFRNGAAGDQRVTHRVVGVVEEGGERRFRTKGDANDQADPELVPSQAVIGRVGFHVPLLGYAITFAQTDLGLALLVIVPAVLLAVTELWDLARTGTDRTTGSSDDTEENGRD
ncbi:signal peptidase I [Halosimplex aquaticum]|uniref:Signal peptidase I n=1 Tax=Halosimplex aquaticum TaxID=3026162 RepID=A0ABD5Y598_9EURY|nr:signal peptidase I [Halosimplex aquaticum]